MPFGAGKNKTSVQEHFLRNDVQLVANGDRRHIEIGLRQCDIRRSCSPNRWNWILFPQWLPAIRKVSDSLCQQDYGSAHKR